MSFFRAWRKQLFGRRNESRKASEGPAPAGKQFLWLELLEDRLAPAVAVSQTDPVPTWTPSVAGNLVHSVEYDSAFVTHVYVTYLGRQPESAGLSAWVDAMQRGLSDERLESQFIGSPEYIAAHGGSGAGWVTGMYVDLLGRTPAPSEVDAWTEILASGTSEADVAHGFAASAERQGIRVSLIYRTFLGRDSSSEEAAAWVSQFVHGATSDDVIAGIGGSTEYIQKQVARITAGQPYTDSTSGAPQYLLDLARQLAESVEDSTAFVSNCYQQYLGRPVDSVGLTGWVAALQQGAVTRERVESELIGSAEYVSAHGGAGAEWVTALYDDLLSRSPSPAEVSAWVDVMAGGASTVEVAYGFAASAEHQALLDALDDVQLTPAVEAAGAGDTLTFSIANNTQLAAVLAELATIVSPLAPGDAPITIRLDLAAGTYPGKAVNVPDGLALVLSGSAGVVFTAGSPALTVTNGEVLVQNGITFQVSTAHPTILVQTGGNLTLQNAVVNESDTSTESAIFVQAGGVLNLSSADNTLNVRGAGQLLTYQAAPALNIVGNTLQADGAAMTSNFAIEDAITHALDNASYGLVTWVANNVYVTTNTLGIQRGVTAASAGNTVNVNDGTYVGNVTINKNLTLLSANGRAATTIQGNSGGAELGAVQITAGSVVQIGGAGQGFHIIGINGNGAIEKAAVYFQGNNTNAQVRENEIEANGDAGLQTEFGATISGFVIDGNIFSGKTFTGSQPSGIGFSTQFNAGNNTPRQLVVIGNGGGTLGTALATNITFTNNQIVGIAGGISSDDNTSQQGNTLVTLDAASSTISGNTFEGTTTRFGSALRVRRPATVIEDNIFDGTNMSSTTNYLFVQNNTTPIQQIVADNIFPDGVIYVEGSDTVLRADTSLQGLINAAPAGATIHVAAGTYSGITIPKALTLIGAGAGQTIIQGASPALTVSSTGVVISGMTYTTATDDPTILVTSTGGLTLRNSEVDESSGFDRAAIRVDAGGALNLGATGDLGGNTINIVGAGSFIDNASSAGISALGNTWEQDGAPITDNFTIENEILHALDAAGRGLVRYVANNLYVTTSSGSIQRGNDAATSGDTVNVNAGSYDEIINVSKSITLLGAGSPTVTRTAGSNQAIFTVTAANVTINGFSIVVNRPFATAGISAQAPASFTGLSILNNSIVSAGSGGTFATGPTVAAVGIYVRGDGGGIETVTIQGNTVNITSGADFFSRGIFLREVQVALGGATPALGNNVTGIGNDLLYQFASTVTGTGTNLIQNNIFRGPFGLDMTEPNAGTLNIWDNDFLLATPIATSRALLIKHNYFATSVVSIAGNSFTGYENSLFSGASRNVTVSNNTFTPAAGATVFRHVEVNTAVPGTNSAPFNPNEISLVGNVFQESNAAGTNGTAIAFFNWNNAASPAFGTVTIGGAGASANTFEDGLDRIIYLDDPASGVTSAANGTLTKAAVVKALDASQNLFDVGSGAKLPTALTLVELYSLEDKIVHKTDVASLGVVTVTANTAYVTPNSFFAPVTTTAAVQRGVDAVASGGTVRVAVGNYVGLVALAGKNSLQLLGAGNSMAGSVLTGPSTSPANSATLDFSNSSGSLVDGFVITRNGNNTTDWNANGMVYGALFSTNASGNTLQNSYLTGNRTAIDLRNNSSGNIIQNNIIDFNRTGVLVFDLTSNNLLQQNFITNNWTVGVLFNDTTTAAVNNTFSNNNISDNWYSQVEDRRVAVTPRNMSGNWFSTTTITTTATLAGEPGYTAQVPVAYGGAASPPGSPKIISGPGHTNVDFTPYLASATDVGGVSSDGFQGDFSTVYVTAAGTQTGVVSRIQEGVDRLASTGTVKILAGSYPGDVSTAAKSVNLSPGASPAQVTVTGNLTLDSNDTLPIEINGTNAATDYDNFLVTGNVTLGGATLTASRGFDPFPGNVFEIIDVGGTLSGQFAGMAEGHVLTLGGIPFTLSYIGGDGNDVTLTVAPPTDVWVNEDWTGTTVGADPDGGISAASSYGYDAFSTISTALAAVAVGGVVHVFGGSYDETLLVNKAGLTLEALNDTQFSEPQAVVTRTSGSNQAIVTVAAPNVTLNGFSIRVNRPFATAGIYASDTLGNFSGVQLRNNTITAVGTGGTFVTPDGNHPSPAIVLLNMSGAVETYTIQGNVIQANSPTEVFSRGVWLTRLAGTLGGPNPGEGNQIVATTQDVLLRFTEAGTTLIQANTFLGAGVDISETNPTPGAINILGNNFTPVSPLFNQSLVIKYNYAAGRTILVDGNTFSGHGNFAIISGSSTNVTVSNNIFTPHASATNYTHVLMSTSYPTGGVPAAILNNSIALTGNQFNGNGAAVGRALDFQNGNSGPSGFGTITVGGAGALANQFAANLTQFIRLSPTPLPAPLFVPASNPSPAPFSVNIGASQNLFDVGSGAKLPTALTLAELYSLEDRIVHKVDVGSLGFVTVTANTAYVTPNSFFAPATTAAAVQRGVDAVASGGTVRVAAGNYVGLVALAGKNNLQLLGAGNSMAGSLLTGPSTSPANSATLDFSNSSGSLVDGFVITRNGNNTTDWNANGMVYGALFSTNASGNTLQNSYLTGNRTAIDLRNNSSGNIIQNNIIDFNRTGVLVFDLTSNNLLQQNFITNNWTVGVLFNDTTTAAVNNTFSNNNISDNWYSQVEDRRVAVTPRNMSGNWFSTTTITTTATLAGEPGYTAQVPVVYGGAASPPGSPKIISGPGHTNVDFTPYLASATDVGGVSSNGFQGDFSTVYVTAAGTQTGVVGRLQEGVDRLASTGTVKILAGSYTGDVSTAGKSVNFSPGASPAQVTVTGNLTLDSNDTLPIEINGTNAATDYDNFLVTGNVTLGGADLSVSLGFAPALLDKFTLIDNDLTDPVSGTFLGKPNGSTFMVGGSTFVIYYDDGDGNDVVLLNVAAAQPTVVYVEDTAWGGFSNGTVIADADFTTPGSQPAIYGYDAFSTLPAGALAVAPGGTVIVNGGTYALATSLSLDKSITLTGPNAAISPNGGTRNAEAIINGSGGPFDNSGPVINLLTGITSLTVQGLEFTNFDGNLFASSLVPVANVNLSKNIFTGNNGGLFYKFDTSIGTDFDVVDNLVSSHSMTGGANTALFFLGHVVGSLFDHNTFSGVAGREAFNLYDVLTNTTISNNTLTNTAGLLLLAADTTDSVITGNVLTNTTAAGAAITIHPGVGIGAASLAGLDITSNTINTNTGSGIIVLATGGLGTSISDLLIEDNTISNTLYGLTLDTTPTTSGVITGVTVHNNQFTNNSFSPILAYSRPTSGVNSVGNLTIEDNTFTVSAGIYTASFYLNDFRNVSGVNSFSQNSLTMSGTLPGGTDAIRAVAIRGSQTGTWNLARNALNGGGVLHNNAPTVFVSGIAILSRDATTGNLPAAAVINATENVITGFEDGIVVRDGVTPAYGGLPAGVQVHVNNNNLAGNSLFAIRTGNAGAVLDASANWYGSNVLATVQSKVAGTALDYTPYLANSTDISVTTGFQGDYSDLYVTAAGNQFGATGRINEAIGLATGIGLIHIHSGTYAESVDATGNDVRLSPGASPGQVVVNGGLTLSSDDTLILEINGTNPATQYDNFVVTGTVTLGSAVLTLTRGFNPLTGDSFTIISNDLGDAVSGTFSGLPEGSVILVSGIPFTLSYAGGTNNNDVVLTVVKPTPVWVNDNWVEQSNDSGGTVGVVEPGDLVQNTGAGDTGLVTGKIFGYNAYSTIQTGVDGVAAGGTVFVLAGTYIEQVTISQALSLLGPNAGIDPNTGVRVNEAFVRPSVGGISNNGSGQFVFSIDVPNITIDGLTIDGDNTSINSSNPINGADPDVDYGIVNNFATLQPENLNAVITNNVIKNINDFGVFLYSTGSGAAHTNNTVSHNKVDNILGAFGQGIHLRDNAFGNVTDNVISRVRNGIVLENFSNNSASTVSLIEDNTITSMRRGIRFNLHYNYTTGGFTLADNDIASYHQTPAAPQGGSTLFVGVEIESVQLTVPVTVSGNSIDGNRATLTGNGYTIVDGIRATNASTASPNIVITGNDITDSLIGIQNETPAVLQITGNTLTGNTTGVNLTSGGATLYRNTITGSTTGVAVNATASLGTAGQHTEENIITGNTTGIAIALGAGTIQAIFNNDLGGNTTSLSNASAATVNASGNWWGNNTLAGVQSVITNNATNVDYTPWLNLSTDTGAATGFQGDFSSLTVTSAGQQVGGGRITEGIGLLATGSLTGGNRLVRVLGGTFVENVDTSVKALTLELGSSPAQVFLTGNLTLGATTTLPVELNGTNAATLYDNFVVTGTVTLGGATLSVAVGYSAVVGDKYTLVDNDGTGDAVSGTFAGLANGATFTAGGEIFVVFYNDGDGNDVVLVNVNSLIPPPVTYVEDTAWTGFTNGTVITDADFVTPGNQTAVIGYDAFTTIQAGITAVASGGTVIVNPGTYKENPNVTKAVTLLGGNRNTPGSGVRAAESIVVTNGNQNAVFTVSSNNVTINGFTIEGNDPLVVGAPVFSGDDANVFYGVRPVSNQSNVVVRDNIVQHVAIGFRGDSASSGNLITENWFDSVGVFDFGYAVSLRENYYADVTNNLMTRVWTGVHTSGFYATGPATWSISGNTIQDYAAGLLLWAHYQNATSVTVASNQITAHASAVANNAGVIMTTIQDTVSPTFTGNTFTGQDYGVILTNTSTSNIVTLGATNAVVNSEIAGVYLTDNLTFNPIGTTNLTSNAYVGPANAIAVNVSLMSISSTGGIGVKVETSRTMAADVTTTATIAAPITIVGTGGTIGVDIEGAMAVASVAGAAVSGFTTGITNNGGTLTLGAGNTLTGGTTGVSISGAGAVLTGNTLDNLVATGQSGNYVALSNAALAGQTVNGTAATYGSVVGSAATVAQAYAIVDKIVDAVDVSTVGYVRIQNSNVFVTPSSFLNPTTTTPDIQRAVLAAASSDTINIQAGTYTGNIDAATPSKNLAFRPGTSPAPSAAQVVNVGSLTLNAGDSYLVDINGTTPATTYDNFVVAGSVTLGGATLAPLAGTYTPAINDVFTIIDNDTAIDAVSGTFGGAPAGTVFTLNGSPVKVFYNGNDGNDVILASAIVPLIYVDDAWSAFTAGTIIADADLGTTGNQPATFGLNAFASVSVALPFLSANGLIIVNDGTYSGAASLTGTQTMDITGPDASGNVSIGGLSSAVGTTINIEGSSSLTLGDSGTQTIAGTVSGSGSFRKSGTGTLSLTNANTYTGGTTLSQGTLVHGNNLATGSTTAPIVVGDAGTGANATTLRFTTGLIDSNVSTVSKPITVNNFGTTTTFEFNQGTQYANVSLAISKAVAITTTAAGTQFGMMGAISGAGAGAGNTSVTFGNTGGGTFTYTAGYSGSGVIANTFLGNVAITGSITLQNLGYINPAYVNGVIPDASSVAISSGATWTQAFGVEPFDALSGGGNLDNNGFLVTLGSAGGSGSHTGVLSGTGALTKIGAGAQSLGGTSPNSYTGNTTILDGTLILAKSANVAAIVGPGTITIGDGSGSAASAILRVDAAEQIANTIDISLAGADAQLFSNLPSGAVETIKPINQLNPTVNDFRGADLRIGGLGTLAINGDFIQGAVGDTPGTTTLAGGILRVGSGGVNSFDLVTGKLQGFGTVTLSKLNNFSTIDPGDATTPGKITIQGNLDLKTTSIITLNLAGTGAGQYDQIAITTDNPGNANTAPTYSNLFTDGVVFFRGTLNVSPIAPYVPTNLSNFDAAMSFEWRLLNTDTPVDPNPTIGATIRQPTDFTTKNLNQSGPTYRLESRFLTSTGGLNAISQSSNAAATTLLLPTPSIGQAKKLSIAALSSVATAVNASVSVVKGGFTTNSSSRHQNQLVTLTNISGAVITGPIYLEVTVTVGTNIQLFNKAGMTFANGKAYVVVSTTSLAAGASVQVQLEWSNPTLTGFTYTTNVLAGGLP